MILGIQAVDFTSAYADTTKPDVLPWESGDLDWFKYVTNGHIVVGGESTYKALQGLKNREAWLASRKTGHNDVIDLINAYEALRMMGDTRHLFICGGGEVWEAFRPYYDAFYTTVIAGDYVEPENAKIWMPAKDQRNYRTVLIQPNRYSVLIVEGPQIDK